MECRPDKAAMPCGVAPRHYVHRTPDLPARVVAVIEGCPFEPAQTPDFLNKAAMYDLTSKEKRDAAENVEKFYEDPQDFRPAGHRQDHTTSFLD
jgi:hypothetical protein